MPDASTNSYTLSEVAHIVEVDEKTLHLYAHKGLLNPTLLSDSEARFTDVDCARLKMIKRANDIGYKPEAIFNLIGDPEQVLDVDDPVSACQQFAQERYKEIFEELSHCEPLEQLNKKCDLKLLKSYLNNLDGREEAPPQKRKLKIRQPQPAPPKHAEETQTIASDQMRTMAPEPEEEPAPTPKVLSYSVDKLWDYVKNTDEELEAFEQEPPPQPLRQAPPQPQRQAPPQPQRQAPLQPQPQQYEETLAFDQDDHTFSDSYNETFSASPHIQRVIGSRWWSTGQDGYRKILSKPTWRNWFFSILILALAITGVVRIFSHTDESPQTQIASEVDRADQQQASETPLAPERDTAAGKDLTQESAKPEGQQSTEQKETVPEEKPTVAAVEKPDEAPPAREKAELSDKPPELLLVRELSLWHDSLNDLYRADFTIVKNIEANNPDPVAGYAFIHLETTPDADPDGVLMPRGDLAAGRPTEFRRGASFSIRHLIKMRVKTTSAIEPDAVASGKLLVYSREGDLLLEKPFNVPIQPFFTPIAEKPITPERTETAEVTPPPAPEPEIAPEPEPEPEPAPRPRPQTPPVQSQETSPAVASATPPAEETLSSTTPGTVPSPVEESIGSDENTISLANIRKTDHPDAAIWEQKSYDAAVKGNFDRAIEDATKAIDLDPGRVNPYINRSWAYIEKNMLDLAINDCKVALHLDPKNTFAYNNRGLAFQRSNQPIRAQNDYRKACELGLDLGCQNLNSLVNQSRIGELIEKSKSAFKAKDWDGVIRATTSVIEIDPQNAVAYTNRSAAYAQKNFLVKALKDSNEAIKFDPQFSLAYNNRGYVFELLGNDRKAAADYLKSCSLGLNLGCKNFDKLN